MDRCLLALLYLALAFHSPSIAMAQQVHVLVVGDTLDANNPPNLKISANVRADIAVARHFFDKRLRAAGIQVKGSQVSDEQFSCDAIISSISRLQVGPNDTVVFYFSGHGSRQVATPTKFPELDCVRKRGDTEVDLSGIVERLKTKKPRLIIAIAETCNKLPTPPGKTRSRLADLPLPPKAMKHLFLEYRGAIALSAAIPGQYSWGTDDGSYFTQQFFRAFDRVISTNDGNVRPRWEAIIVDAIRDIEVPTRPPKLQSPQVATWHLVEQWPAP